MSRPIKFRSWGFDSKIMSRDRTLKEICDKSAKIGLVEWNDSVIVMQYTGLKDKNGVEIYEGDIVQASLLGDGKRHGYKDEVQFRGRGIIDIDPVHLMVNFKDGHRDNFYIYEAILHRETEVIGNLYENPELLEDK